MTVNPGELDKRIKIISTTATEDDDGYHTETETVERTCWAKLSRTSGTELAKNNADFSNVKCRFLIRYAAGIDRKMIVRYSRSDYEIVYVNDYDDKHEYIELWCERMTQEVV